MFDAELLRKLCGQISAEQDPQRLEELISILQTMIREDIDDVRTRLAFLRERYAAVFGEVPLPDPPA